MDKLFFYRIYNYANTTRNKKGLEFCIDTQTNMKSSKLRSCKKKKRNKFVACIFIFYKSNTHGHIVCNL